MRFRSRVTAALGDSSCLASNRLSSLRRGYTAFTIIAINTLLLLAMAEGTARLWDAVEGTAREPRDPRALLSYYQNVPWGAAYWVEYTRSASERYEPFVVWRRSPFAGDYINIDSAGQRTARRLPCADSATHVAVFGGSTVWGTGAPDEYTIPARLQRALNATGKQSFCVTNYGESGYVTSQEVIALLEQIRRDAPIDVAIFYDGINDVYAAFQNGRADAHQNLAQIAARFGVVEKRSRAHRLEDWLYENSRAYHRIRNAAPKSSRNSVAAAFTARDSVLVDRAIENYLFNVELVQHLGERYAFRALFFWQPVIYTSRKQLSSDEQRMLKQLDSRAIQFYTYAARSLAARHHPMVIDLTSAFDETKEMIWIDWAHITPEGNHIIARNIAAHIEQ